MGKQPISVSSLIAERLCVGVKSVAEYDDSGGDNNLLVTVSDFDPYLWSENVRCFGRTAGFTTYESCNNLADWMDASEAPKIFGPQSRPHDYITPHTIRKGKDSYTAEEKPRDVNGHSDRQSMFLENHESSQQPLQEKCQLVSDLGRGDNRQCNVH